MNDSDLIQGLLNQQTSAINYFVNNYQQLVFILCVKMVNSTEIAEEITQDVMIKCIEKIDQFKGEAKLKTWVYTLAKREALNYIRINQLQTVPIDGNETMHQKQTLVEEALNTDDIHTIIQQNFSKLSLDHKEILTLFYLQELSLKEIAELTTLSESNVRVKLHRARERFKNIVSEKDLSLLKQLRYD